MSAQQPAHLHAHHLLSCLLNHLNSLSTYLLNKKGTTIISRSPAYSPTCSVACSPIALACSPTCSVACLPITHWSAHLISHTLVAHSLTPFTDSLQFTLKPAHSFLLILAQALTHLTHSSHDHLLSLTFMHSVSSDVFSNFNQAPPIFIAILPQHRYTGQLKLYNAHIFVCMHPRIHLHSLQLCL